MFAEGFAASQALESQEKLRNVGASRQTVKLLHLPTRIDIWNLHVRQGQVVTSRVTLGEIHHHMLACPAAIKHKCRHDGVFVTSVNDKRSRRMRQPEIGSRNR